MRYEKIPQELKNLDQWVCAYDTSKIPMSGFRPEAASSTDPETWAFWEQVEWAVTAGHYDHVGFVFADNGYVGIDVDTGFDEFGLMTPECARIVNKCKSYTEKSKSGRGVHIILRGDLPFHGKNNMRGIEIYKARRFFILTGEIVQYDTIIANQEAIDFVVKEHFSTENSTSFSGNYSLSDRIYTPIWNEPKVGKIPLSPTYPIIAEGGRNLSLTSLAGSMHTTGYEKKHILTELRKANKVACKPPLPDSELVTIANSIGRYKR